MFDCGQALDALAEAAGAESAPLWAMFDRDDGDADGFTLRPGPGELFGWRAPAGCWAIGVVSGGTARPIDGGQGRDRRCRVAFVANRWGGSASLVQFADGDISNDAPQAGRLFDAVARCFDRPTHPPSSDPAATLSLVWLAAVTVERLVQDRRLRWDEAIALHPVARLLGVEPAADGDRRAGAGDSRAGDPLASLVVAASARWSWEDVRSRCVETGVTIADVDSTLAAWMDAGMMSRWLEEVHAHTGPLVTAGIEALRPEDHPAVRRVLSAAWDSGATSAASAGVPGRRRCRARRL